jgi:dUTP pyrophosphatase
MNSTLYIKANDNVKIFYSDRVGYNGDSGLDLYFPEDVTINPGEVEKIDLGISCEMTEECLVEFQTLKKLLESQKVLFDDYEKSLNMFSNLLTENKNVSYYLYPRSSISNTPLILTNNVGIVDASYRGNIKAALRNISTGPYTVKRGERLLQICSGNLKPFNFKLVDSLSETDRGSGGFGSTGR